MINWEGNVGNIKTVSSSWAYYFQVDIMPSSDIGVGQSIIGFTPCIDLV